MFLGWLFHTLDPQWNFRSVLMSARSIGKHKSENLYKDLIESVEEFNLKEKSFGATTDNAANMLKMQRQLTSPHFFVSLILLE